MADENLAAIDEDSKAMLEDHVKKGKARKFILITKGATIKTLIVFKKGPFGPKVTKAKKDGFRGEVTCGVITGKGVNVTFKLPGTAEVSSAMKTEGNVYDGEPCKIAKLRAFFKDEAELKFKPEFQVVKQLSDVTTVSELEDETEGNLADVALGDAEQAERKRKLVDVLKKLTSVIQQAVTAQPIRKNEILAPVTTIKEQLQSDQLDEAKKGILEYHEFLKKMLADAPHSSPTAPPPPPPPPLPEADPNAAKESEWKWRSEALTPKLKQVLRDKIGDFGQIAAVFKQAQAAKSGDVAGAVELLKQCAGMVDFALKEAEGDWEDPTTAEFRNSWESMSGEFKSQRNQIREWLPGKIDAFDGLVKKATSLADAGEFEKAIAAALNTAAIVEEAARAKTQLDVGESVEEGVVVFRSALLRWNLAMADLMTEVRRLQAAMRKKAPAAGKLADEVDVVLDQFNVGLDDVLKDGMNQPNEELRKPFHDAALELIEDFKSKSDGELLKHLDECMFEKVNIRGVLTKALGDLESQLAS